MDFRCSVLPTSAKTAAEFDIRRSLHRAVADLRAVEHLQWPSDIQPHGRRRDDVRPGVDRDPVRPVLPRPRSRAPHEHQVTDFLH